MLLVPDMSLASAVASGRLDVTGAGQACSHCWFLWRLAAGIVANAASVYQQR